MNRDRKRKVEEQRRRNIAAGRPMNSDIDPSDLAIFDASSSFTSYDNGPSDSGSSGSCDSGGGGADCS